MIHPDVSPLGMPLLLQAGALWPELTRRVQVTVEEALKAFDKL